MQGIAISISDSGKAANISLTIVEGEERDKLKIQNHEKNQVGFSGDSLDISAFTQYINFRILQLVDKGQDKTTGIPLVLGFQESLLPSLRNGLGIPNSPSYTDLCDLLTEKWTLAVRRLFSIHGNYGIYLNSNNSAQSTIAQFGHEEGLYRNLVANIHNPQAFAILKQVAFEDGVIAMGKRQEGRQFLIKSLYKFILFGEGSDHILFTYINAHPELKQEFVRGMMSVLPEDMKPYFVCVKTGLDKPAPQFTDLVGAYLADRIPLKEGEKPFGHVQVLV